MSLHLAAKRVGVGRFYGEPPGRYAALLLHALLSPGFARAVEVIEHK